MSPGKIKKIAILIPTFALAILLVQQNYSWIFGMLIDAAIAMSSCELIQKAVRNSFVRKRSRITYFFLFGFFFRFVLFAGLLYAAIVKFHVNPIAIVVSFSIIQFLYPIYIVRMLEDQKQHV